MNPVEDRYQRLTWGIELLNLLSAVDLLEASTPPSPEKLHAVQMRLVQTPIYSKSEIAERSYQDLQDFRQDIVSVEAPTKEAVSQTQFSGQADALLRFLRAVQAQRQASAHQENIRYLPESCEDPAGATKALVDQLLHRLANL